MLEKLVMNYQVQTRSQDHVLEDNVQWTVNGHRGVNGSPVTEIMGEEINFEEGEFLCLDNMEEQSVMREMQLKEENVQFKHPVAKLVNGQNGVPQHVPKPADSIHKLEKDPSLMINLSLLDMIVQQKKKMQRQECVKDARQDGTMLLVEMSIIVIEC